MQIMQRVMPKGKLRLYLRLWFGSKAAFDAKQILPHTPTAVDETPKLALIIYNNNYFLFILLLLLLIIEIKY